jgi:hypothetical protein
MRVVRIFLAIFTTLLFFCTPSTPALGESVAQFVYLPLISVPCPQPILYSPEDAAQLDTLTPTFHFQVPIDPGVIGVGVDVSANPNFMPMAYAIGSFGGGGEFTWRIYSNLEPATTYFWRAETKCGNSVSTYSEVRTFVTGSGGEILPAPALLSPADMSTTDSTDVTFEWSPVAGADSYMLSYQAEGSWWMSLQVTETQSTRTLQPDKNYIWYVRALNAYGMGLSSEVWHFTTPSQ